MSDFFEQYYLNAFSELEDARVEIAKITEQPDELRGTTMIPVIKE